MPAEETLRRDRQLLKILAVFLHPCLADRQPAIGSIADTDKAETFCLLERGEPRRPDFTRRERRGMIGTVEGERLAHFRGAGDHSPARAEARAPGLRQLTRQFGARAMCRRTVRVDLHPLRRDPG